MRVLVNLLPLSAGGGVQVALDSLMSLEGTPLGSSSSVVARRSSLLAGAIPATIDRPILVKGGLLNRVYWEERVIPRMADADFDVVYTLFGRGIGRTVRTPTVVGSAYSNIYFPEIDFWRGHSPIRRKAARIKDRVRLRRTLSSDGWMFETPLLADRARNLFGLPPERVAVIPPSLSLSFQEGHASLAETGIVGQYEFSIIMVTSWNPNKNLTILPEVLAEVRRRKPEANVGIVVTVDPEDSRSKALTQRAKSLDVGAFLRFVGPVDPRKCKSLYLAADCVLLLSELESFSNNVLEAWATDCPLVVSDKPWARVACGDAARYVDRDDHRAIATGICELIQDETVRSTVTEAGRARLTGFPSSAERIEMISQFLGLVTSLGKN